jgi:putative FmdB family regulatory protein
MPTYDYRCERCGNFEAVHGMKDPSLSACPTCGGPVTRLISKGGGLIFKGSGFYITDYRSADYKQKAEKESAEAKPAAAADPKTTGSGEAKPAAAAPPAGGTGAPSSSSASSASTPSAPTNSSGGTTPA